MAAVNAFDAVNAVIAEKWPQRYVYVNLLPKNFTRPSFFLQQISATSERLTRSTEEWTVALMLDCFVSVNDYNEQSHTDLLALQAEVLALFSGGSIAAGDRHLQVSAVNGGSNPGEAYVDITVRYVDDVPAATAPVTTKMNDININYWRYELMPMPSINITFAARAATASRRSGQGTVAMILLDAAENGLHTLYSASDIPDTLGADNIAYVERAFVGNVNRPAKVLLYVLPASAEDYNDALAELAKYTWDWLCCPPDIDATLAAAVKTWIVAQRTDQDALYKAVLPALVADHEAIVNFITDGITVGLDEFDEGEYCSRIAGLLAGTPLRQSATYAVLPEVSDVTRLTKADMDTAVDAGKLLLFHDGVKVKTGRAVTSLTTLGTKSAQLKKIKIVEALDLIKNDLRVLMQDSYIGKYANSYDNKCVLITAIQDYFKGLEREGILQAWSTVAIDIDAQRAYLVAAGVDVSTLTDKEIKEANTDDKVFLAASIRILDAIEDIALPIQF